MTRILKLKNDNGIHEYDINTLRAYYFETQRDGSMPFVLYFVEGGREIIENSNLTIQLIES